MCGIGVTSFNAEISRPAAESERIAASRPEPGPLTQTSTFLRPRSIASLAVVVAANCAANGVDFLEPLKPTVPAEAQQIVLPEESAIVTIVLLKVALI